jgi:two-component system sensor histidine kinase TctE
MSSLRVRLLGWLMPPLMAVGIAAAWGAYAYMEHHLEAAYDLDLGDIARALVPHLHTRDGTASLELTELADTVLRADSSDRIFYAVRDGRGQLIGGDPILVAGGPLDASPRFWDAVLEGEAVRAVGFRSAGATFIAAETTRKRDKARNDALLSAVAPVALLLGAAMIATVLGVRRGLLPLERLREEIATRSHADLSAVDERHADEELAPLVHALNEMLRRLESAQSTQARFIANAAHQLKTPIAGLVTQLDLAGDDVHVAQARQAAARLARLARQILSLAAADPTSNPVARNEPFDLADVVKGHADAWMRAATARKVDMEFALEPALVAGNSLLAGELASNLVDNATRYGAKTVKVVTRRASGRSILEVLDDGPGIPQPERLRIFERFYRLDNQSTEGSGLGLAIVHEIAQLHGASAQVTGAAGGSGTCVQVSFPAAASRDAV